ATLVTGLSLVGEGLGDMLNPSRKNR
ncbi:MAG: hypothetical protein RLZZ381_3001, partial [Cyanobacteriota bacterium]